MCKYCDKEIYYYNQISNTVYYFYIKTHLKEPLISRVKCIKCISAEKEAVCGRVVVDWGQLSHILSKISLHLPSLITTLVPSNTTKFRLMSILKGAEENKSCVLSYPTVLVKTSEAESFISSTMCHCILKKCDKITNTKQ